MCQPNRDDHTMRPSHWRICDCENPHEEYIENERTIRNSYQEFAIYDSFSMWYGVRSKR